jgi:hypothetical protein
VNGYPALIPAMLAVAASASAFGGPAPVLAAEILLIAALGSDRWPASTASTR